MVDTRGMERLKVYAAEHGIPFAPRPVHYPSRLRWKDFVASSEWAGK